MKSHNLKRGQTAYCACGKETRPKKTNGGFDPHSCDECLAAARRARNAGSYKKYKESGATSARTKKWRRENPELYLLKSAKDRAAARGHEFSITIDDIKIPSHCPVFGTPLIAFGGRGANGASPSIDRIDNSKGYVRGNVAIISSGANALKRNATISQIELLLKYMKEGVVD